MERIILKLSGQALSDNGTGISAKKIETVVKEIKSTQTELNCGMGSIDVQGKLTSKINAECGMGSIVATIMGNESDYGYQAQVGLGEVKVGNNKINGLSQYTSTITAENKIIANCGMGAIKFHFK